MMIMMIWHKREIRFFFFDDQDEPVVEVKEVQHQLVNLNNSFAIRTQ